MRGESVIFQINRRGKSGYEAVDVDPDGFQGSEVFGCSFRLDRSRNEDGFWQYDLGIEGEPPA